MSGEALFLADILGGRENRDERDNFSASDARSFDDDDAEQFSTATIKSAGDDEQSDDSSARPTYVCASIPPSVPHASNVPTEISVQSQPAPPLIPTFVNHPNVVRTATVDESLPPVENPLPITTSRQTRSFIAPLTWNMGESTVE